MAYTKIGRCWRLTCNKLNQNMSVRHPRPVTTTVIDGNRQRDSRNIGMQIYRVSYMEIMNDFPLMLCSFSAELAKHVAMEIG